jgi:tagatose 6-phosphate kinase
MILTVTPNPTIDRVLFVRDFAMQDMVRAEGETVAPSGKGIDVSALLHAFGVETLALGLSAGLSGDMLAALMDEIGAPYEFIPANGYTRVAALITDKAQGRQSTIVAHTLTAEPAHLDRLLALAEAKLPSCWGLVCAGSLPPGLPADAYPRLLALGKAHGAVTLLDSSGESLRNSVAALPDILKINLSELAALAPDAAALWRHRAEQAEVVDDAGRLADALAPCIGVWAAQALIITLGKQGALAITPEGRWYVPALDAPVVSPAGAGDAVSAGLMMARFQGKDWREALALGTAMAAAVVGNPGTCECYPHQVEAFMPLVQSVEV